jgi:hypothetical protein
MLGRAGSTAIGDRQVSATAPLGGAVSGAPIRRASGSGATAQEDTHDSVTPWALVGLLVLYLGWALLEQHQRIKSQVRPSNVAMNLRNLIAIILPVILGIALLKIGLAKLHGWFADVPVLGTVTGVAIRIVGMA